MFVQLFLYFCTETMAKKLIERHICSICQSVVKLPAVQCQECSQVMCLDPCFNRLEPKSETILEKECPFQCELNLVRTHGVDLFIKETLKEQIFQCDLEGCKDYQTRFLYDSYKEHLKEHRYFQEMQCPLECGQILNKFNINGHIRELVLEDFFTAFGIPSPVNHDQFCPKL